MQHLVSLKTCLMTVIMAAIFFLPSVEAQASARKPVTIAEDSPLSLRVLVRPKAVLYADATGSKAIEGQLPVFKSYFVYTRPGGESRATGTGWYEVGTDENGKIVGWLKASDVFEWKQTMCLVYTHPEGRKPVLMFETEQALADLVKKAPEVRTQEVNKLYGEVATAATKPLPEDFPVLSVEPNLAIDISKQFYLLPILDHKSVTLGNYEGRLLQLAAVSAKADVNRDKPSDIRVNQEYAKAAAATAKEKAAEKKDIKYDIVWVMDTTRSMQPYIEEVRNTLTKMSKDIGNKPELKDRIAFGLWAYRDSTDIKNIEYLTKNFTPQLQPLDAFVTTLQGVKETKVDSVDVDEDMFAGVMDAIEKTAWREGASRVIIVVGDAPAHAPGHQWNSTGLSENDIRTIASEHKITIFGMHVEPNVKRWINRTANKQLTALSTNAGTEDALLWSTQSKDRKKFEENSATLTGYITEFLETTLKEAQAAGATQAAPTTPTAEKAAAAVNPAPATAPVKGTPSKEQVQRALRAGMVTWLGRVTQIEAPNDVEAWVVDKDLLNPATQSLEVRLLISKRQLDSLAVIMKDIITAGYDAQMGSTDFFKELQSVSATASRNADKLAQAKSLNESGLVPAFLNGLPYQSQIMSMSPELWESMGEDAQNQFLDRLNSKLAAYESISNAPNQWVALNQGDAADDYVTALPLDLLP